MIINTLLNGQPFPINEEVWNVMSDKEKQRFTVVSDAPPEVKALNNAVTESLNVKVLAKKNEIKD